MQEQFVPLQATLTIDKTHNKTFPLAEVTTHKMLHITTLPSQNNPRTCVPLPFLQPIWRPIDGNNPAKLFANEQLGTHLCTDTRY